MQTMLNFTLISDRKALQQNLWNAFQTQSKHINKMEEKASSLEQGAQERLYYYLENQKHYGNLFLAMLEEVRNFDFDQSGNEGQAIQNFCIRAGIINRMIRSERKSIAHFMDLERASSNNIYHLRTNKIYNHA